MSAPAAHIELAATADFELGGTAVQPSACEISGSGQTVTLEPRVMQVLVLLAQRKGETVTRDDLIAGCWRGVIVGEDAIQRCIGRLRKAAAITGGFEIRTLNRIGYRLAALQDTGPAPAPPAVPTRAARPAVAFLDMRVFGGASGAEAFAQLLAHDLRAALSLNRDLHVVAGGAALDSADIQALRRIGDELGVRYIADGTLRRVAEEHRITAQLVEAATGRILWNHRTDIADIDTPTDDLVIDLAGRLSMEIMRHETDRALRDSADMTAWEAVVRANTAYQRISTGSLPFAIAESRRAVELDPHFAAAHAALANGLAAAYEVGGALEPALAAEAQVHCDRALALDSNDATVLAWVANALSMITRPQRGMELALRAVELAPTHPIAHLYLARRYLYLGDPQAALASIAEHERVAPLFPWQYFIAFNKSLAHFMAGRMDQALHEADRAALLNPQYPYTWLAKAILGTMLGQPDEAAEAIRRLRRLEGEDSLDLQVARIAHSYPEGPVRTTLQTIVSDTWQRAAAEGIRAGEAAPAVAAQT